MKLLILRRYRKNVLTEGNNYVFMTGRRGNFKVYLVLQPTHPLDWGLWMGVRDEHLGNWSYYKKDE